MHNKLNFRTFFLVAFCVVIYLFSCRKQNPSWDVDVLAPLVKSTLTVNNIIPDSVLHKNPDNSLDIVYNTSLYSFSTVNIPDTIIDTIYKTPIPLTLSHGTYFVNPVNQEQKFPVSNGAQLTKVIIRSGKLIVRVRNYVEEMIRVRYKIPSATFGGIPFDKTFDVPAQIGGGCPGTPTVFTHTYDMSDYVFDFTGSSGNGFNTLITNVSAQINPLAINSVTVTPCDSIYVGNSFVDMVPQYAKGYFGNTITNINDSSSFSLFRHIIGGKIDLQDVNIGLSIENNVGADARVTINNLTSVNTRTGSTLPLLSSAVIGSPININRAIDNNGNVASSTYSVSLTLQNSNIKEFVENFPDRLSYKVQYEINPLGNVSGNNDFIYYGKLMKANLNMTIPLSLVANNLTMADTVNFNMNANSSNVNYGNLYLYFDNGFPFTAQAQLYLMNAQSAITDSLIIAPNVISDPSLDANDVCIGKKETKLTIPVDEIKINKLRSAKKIYIKVKFNTSHQSNYMKIYSFYEMNVKVVGDFNYTVGKK